MDSVKLKYGTKSFELPRICVTVTDITALFQVQPDGLHLKIKDNEGVWKNEFPDEDGIFDAGVGDCYVVSLIYSHH